MALVAGGWQTSAAAGLHAQQRHCHTPAPAAFALPHLPSRCSHHHAPQQQRIRLRAVASPPETIAIQKPRLTFVGQLAAAQAEGVCSDKALWGSSAFGGAAPPAPTISKTDAEFLALGLEFVESGEGIKVTELNELFEKVGFPRRDPDRLKVALANTHRLIWIRSLKQSRVSRLGQLLGFARATSDGVLSATIWDVAVSPAWQRSGLGRAMIERLTQQLVQDGIGTITLYAEPQVVGLYKKLGFVDDPQGIRGMAFQRKKKEKRGLF